MFHQYNYHFGRLFQSWFSSSKKYMFVPLLALILLVNSQEIYASPPPAQSLAEQQSQLTLGDEERTISHSQHTSSSSPPQITLISLNDTILFPKELITEEPGCFGDQTLKISWGQMLTIRANQPFITFFKTQTALHYYNFEQYYGNSMNKIIVNYLVESKEQSEGLFTAVIPLDLKCTYITNPYLKMIGKVHVDFYEQGQENSHSFSFILVCASEQTNQEFLAVYRPGYIFFWVYCNLVLQIYNAYHRDRTHFAMFLVFLGSSMLIQDQLYGYVISVSLFLLVLLREKRQSKLNLKAFSLYLTFFMLAITLILFTYSAKEDGSDWNSLWIALQNFIQVHITMFMILRLLKLHRLRAVFWYFVVVSLFAVLYGDNNNIFFSLNFKNPLDLSCLKASLFFPLMMLPISNYFTSLTGWMHRVIGAGLTLSALLPLEWGIATMALVIVCVEIYEIKTKSLQVIKHTY